MSPGCYVGVTGQKSTDWHLNGLMKFHRIFASLRYNVVIVILKGVSVRDYQFLDTITEEGGRLLLTNREGGASHSVLALAQEGDKIVISASIGALDLALRLRLEELKRQLNSMRPVPGLSTTRQVGTVQAFMGLGLLEDNRLVLRPTLLVDATGKLSFNLLTSEACYRRLLEWINAKN